MRLLITTPMAVAVDRSDVVSVRAEDETGAFGILSGHADFLTSLAISVVSWRECDGKEGHCAVRQGVLTVTGGEEVAIATRDAVVGDDLDRLEQEVLARYRETVEAERAARLGSAKMHLEAVRQIVRYLRPGHPAEGGAP
jgi:F-type H+-transporting ATPase subunit epsilon